MPLPDPPALGTAMLPRDTYQDQVVLVTGAGTGLGRAMAVEFARVGASLAVMSRKSANVADGVRSIEEIGGRAIGVSADVRDPAQVSAAFDTVERELGVIDV